MAIAIVAGGWAFSAYMDRQMDSSRLVERLANTPVPAELVLIDEWNHDGDWLFKPRQPSAVRKYAMAGNVDEVCRMLDDFYDSRSLAISPTSRSDNPDDWCGRSLTTNGGRLSIWVEPLASWTEPPAEVASQPELTQVSFYA